MQYGVFGLKIGKKVLHGKTKPTKWSYVFFLCMLVETLKLLVMYSSMLCEFDCKF